MKRMKKIIVTILSLAMMMGLCVTVNAAESDQNYNEIYYKLQRFPNADADCSRHHRHTDGNLIILYITRMEKL